MLIAVIQALVVVMAFVVVTAKTWCGLVWLDHTLTLTFDTPRSRMFGKPKPVLYLISVEHYTLQVKGIVWVVSKLEPYAWSHIYIYIWKWGNNRKRGSEIIAFYGISFHSLVALWQCFNLVYLMCETDQNWLGYNQNTFFKTRV